MANKVPAVIADFESQLSTSLAVGGTSFSLSSATDDDGNSLPAGKYCFTVDNGKSNKEYLLGQLNGTAVTSVVRVSRQGVETSGTAYAHRVGASVIISDFATIQRVADILRGLVDLDGTSPMAYDAEPTLADRKEIATVGYVLDTVTGGTVAFDTQTTTGNGGENIVAGELIYFKTSDQEWYKTDADTAGTVEGVVLGIALGAGSDGVGITGGILLAGVYTTSGLTAGSEYYASNTAGAYSTSAGTTSRKVGLALSTTKLYLYPSNPQTATTREKDAMAGGGDWGTPGTSNKFLTQDYMSNSVNVQEFTSNGTWTKPSRGTLAIIQLFGAGGGGASYRNSGTRLAAAGGAGGAYVTTAIPLSALSETESVTIGSGGAGGTGTSASSGAAGGSTTFKGVTAPGGGGGDTSSFDGSGESSTVAQGGATSSFGGEAGGNSGRFSYASSVQNAPNTTYAGAGGGSASTSLTSLSTPGSSTITGFAGGAAARSTTGNVTASAGANTCGGGGAVVYSATAFTATGGAGGNGFARIIVI
jgi:hypothetical protein